MTAVLMGSGVFHVGDCFDVMTTLPDASVDMVLCDLPYGTTQNKWDVVLPLDDLWRHWWRVAKSNASIVLTAQCPFDKILGTSQIQNLKYEWVWEKIKATGHLNAKTQPMRAHENILVFCRARGIYNPIMEISTPYVAGRGKSNARNYGVYGRERNDSPDGTRYPRSVIHMAREHAPLHPTQKPVALFKYLIRTYTNPGDVVLDNCAGSGTTAIAAEQSDRKWICIERDETYSTRALARIWGHVYP